MNWQPIGPHRYRREDDLLYWQPDGEMTVEHIRAISAVFDELLARYGYVVYIIDARRSRPMGYDARREFVHWFDRSHPRFAAIGYGSPAEPRATAVLIVNAARLRGNREAVMHSAANEAEALILAEAERGRFRRELLASSESAAGGEPDELTREFTR